MLFFLKATTFWIIWNFFFFLAFLWFCFQLFKKKTQAPESSYSMADLSQATIFNATKGDIVILSGYGNGFDDVHLTVKEHNGYRLENGFTWDEVICEYKGRELCIEAEKDQNEIFISATSEDRRQRLEDLLTPEEMPMTQEILAQYQEEDTDKNYLLLHQKRFYYNESKECLYMPNKIEDDGELFFYWDFEDEEEEEIISIEIWENAAPEVFRGTILNPDFVSVLKAQ